MSNFVFPAQITITSRGLSVALPVATLSPELLVKAALHGLKQKVSDAAAGAMVAAWRNREEGETVEAYEAARKVWAESDAGKADIASKGQALMQKVCDTLVAGDWGADRATGSGLTDVQQAMAKLFIDGAKMTFEKAVKTDARYEAAWARIQESMKGKALEQLTATAEKLVARAKEEKARREAEAAELAAILGGVIPN